MPEIDWFPNPFQVLKDDFSGKYPSEAIHIGMAIEVFGFFVLIGIILAIYNAVKREASLLSSLLTVGLFALMGMVAGAFSYITTESLVYLFFMVVIIFAVMGLFYLLLWLLRKVRDRLKSCQ